MENNGGRGESLLAPAIDVGDYEKGGGGACCDDEDYHSMLRARDDFFHRFDGGAWKRHNYDVDAYFSLNNNKKNNKGRRSKGFPFL